MKQPRIRRVGIFVAMASGVTLTGARMLGAARRWGASGEEIASIQPGDDVVADPQLVSTRAITIEAPPADVFPWLTQLGQGRGGFYSYDWVENLIGLDVHSADTLLPEFREVRAGTQIRMAPGPKFYGFVVVDAEAPTHLVLQMRIDPFTGEQLEPAPRRQGPEVHASWAFVVTPIAEGGPASSHAPAPGSSCRSASGGPIACCWNPWSSRWSGECC